MNKFLIILLAWPGFIFSSVFIDVRTPEEHASESIINTYNIEWQNILDIEEVATKNDEIYLFCRSGNRSQRAKKILEEAGYQKVFNIGGFKEASDYIKEKVKVLKIDAT